MRKFKNSNRAQAMQIGFILIFGLLVLSLSLYQANVVPDQNKNAEITHSNDLEFEFSSLESDIFNTGMTGTPTTKTYPMSMKYPNRFITINPLPPSATLSTSSTNNIIISNSSVEHEVPTRYLKHDVDYRLYDNPPVYTYETGFTYRNFDEAQTAISNTQFVLNDGFAIVALQGEYNETSYTNIRIPIEQTDSLVEYKITDPEITVPTKLTEENWNDFVDNRNNLEVEYNEEEKTATLSREGTMPLFLTSASIGASTDGGVNHDEINLPVSDIDTTPGDPSDPSDPSESGFEFDSVSGERSGNNQIDYSFTVSAGESDITQVEVRLENTNGDRADDVDIYDENSEEFDTRGFSVESEFTGLGGPNNEFNLIIVAQNENNDEITETIIDI